MMRIMKIRIVMRILVVTIFLIWKEILNKQVNWTDEKVKS